jgi:hypothetical protein
MNDSPKGNEAQDRLKLFEVSSESQRRRDRRKRKKGFSYEGTRGSVMLNGGPVNKFRHKAAQKPQMVSLIASVLLGGPI